MTFTELSIGLSVLQIENSVGIAAIIAVADILPVIGTGSVLIPWSIVALFMQNYFLAAGLIILYIVVLAVRNFTEPKIVGDQLGLNPIVTLISIYLGYRIMGFGGMIVLPVATNILVGLHKSGKIKLWKE
jgi:predicted PurR-regulated permease PerM